MTDTADVVIVGGAAMGASTAYHLAADPGFRGRVVVIEKDPTYRLAASALSATSIRQQFSTPVNIRLSQAGIRFLREAATRLAVDGEAPDIALRERGYLYLASPAGRDALAANHQVQVAEGADVEALDPDGLKARFPWLHVTDLAGGSFGRSGEGWFDGWSLLQALRRKARALGAVFRTGAVTEVERTGGRVTAVRLSDGSRIACGALVNAAGSGGPALAALCGVALPVCPKRRNVFTFTCRTPVAGCPLIVDTSGAWVRPEGEGFICGASPAPGEPDPDWRDDDPATQAVDWALFEERIWPALARRVPAFESVRPGRAWTGPYDMSLFDHNAFVGPVPDLPNLYLCNGFSGHGLQQAPAVGQALAEHIVHGGYRTLDLSDLAYGRIAAGRPVIERNVI